MGQSVQEVGMAGLEVVRDRTKDVFVVERPWGRFQQFATNETVTVKTITVEPGCRLSLQTHNHRAEMWHVLEGAADVEVNDRSYTAYPGDMIWVGPGDLHRIGNSTLGTTRILEVAFGMFDEEDIIRLQDDYARCPEA